MQERVPSTDDGKSKIFKINGINFYLMQVEIC